MGATGEKFHGIDVSWYQKKIDWETTARDKRVTFVFIKATEGGKLQDPNYRYNIDNARRMGIKVGSYHFLRPETPARQQFDNFKARVKRHEQDLIPVIDIEDIPEMGIRWKPQQARDVLKQMADLIESHYGCRPMIYTSNKFFTDYLGRAFADYPLFIARYGNVEPEPQNGASWTLWQFTKSGRVDGIDHNVDLSRFNKGRSLASIAMHKGKKKRADKGDEKSKPKARKHRAASDKAATANHRAETAHRVASKAASKVKNTSSRAKRSAVKKQASAKKSSSKNKTAKSKSHDSKAKKK